MARLESTLLQPAETISDRQSARDNLLHSQKMAALGELASGITHDFRNILQTVISSLEIIESRSEDPAQVRRLVASALRASERGIGLTERLLRFSRNDTAAARPVSLLSSLESATETLARTVEARMNVGIEPPPPDLWPVAVDPIEFELALINLGLNARDAMPDGGRIRFSARNVTIPPVDRRDPRRPVGYIQVNRRGSRLPLSEGDYVAVSVGDTGTGMDQLTLARAVEPFFTTKPVGKGTGLGLAAVHSLATEVHGALRLKSEVGHGTIVELWFPRAREVVITPSG
jgi:signal transduction histidine kinase